MISIGLVASIFLLLFSHHFFVQICHQICHIKLIDAECVCAYSCALQ